MQRDVFQAIADPTRRAILGLVACQAMTPNTLATHFEMSRQAVSKHIHLLSEAELVYAKPNGREVYYHLNPIRMKEVADWLAPFQQLWESRFIQLDNVLQTLTEEKK
ncbi:MAG: winged helix-turn-helix transcriptional regulator [Bacteroidetes Order II. Incertae sedis bacterium]|nr:winged helix-turn-helix transcriptional regulator [Bacteroidetes Order II. bacterium]